MVKFSEMAEAEAAEVTKKRRPYIDTSPRTNPKFTSFANRTLRKQAVEGVNSIQRDEKARLGEKFYYLDHTAEVLENYRKINENKIFDRLLHDERQKKAFLKNESRKVQNLLETTKYDTTN